MGGEEGKNNYPPDFDKEQREPLIDLDLSDSTELWLIQFPIKHDVDFDGQEVSLKLHKDGSLGNFTGTSGNEYEVVSYKSLDADATVFVSSASESKVVGKISRRVSFVHYPEPVELSMYDPNRVKEEREREFFERTVEKTSSRNGPSMSRSTLVTNRNGWSKQTNSSRSSKQGSVVSQVSTPSKSSRNSKQGSVVSQVCTPSKSSTNSKQGSAVSQVSTPSKSSRKRQSPGSSDRSTQDSKRGKVKQEQE